MQTANKKQVILNVNPEIADRIQTFSEREPEKLEFLLKVFVSRPEETFFLRPNESGWEDLEKRLNDVGDKAKARGLTPEKLESKKKLPRVSPKEKKRIFNLLQQESGTEEFSEEWSKTIKESRTTSPLKAKFE